MDEAQKHYAEREKPDAKRIHTDSIYGKFKNRQEFVSSVRSQNAGCLWRMELIGKSHEGAFWVMGTFCVLIGVVLHRCIHLSKLIQTLLSLKRFRMGDEIHEKRAKGALSVQGKV